MVGKLSPNHGREGVKDLGGKVGNVPLGNVYGALGTLGNGRLVYGLLGIKNRHRGFWCTWGCFPS